MGSRSSSNSRTSSLFYSHFCYRHAVDNHNNLCHGLPSIKDTWCTHRWEVRVFGFILAVCEVNAFLVLRCFVFGNNHEEALTLLVFRCQLAWQLINNEHLGRSEEEDQMLLAGTEHVLLLAPAHAKEYQNRRWICTATFKYQQYKCGLKCGRRVRTYCACNPSMWVCTRCHAKHVFMALQEE